MNEIIKIKCPECGAVLSVKEQPGMVSKSLTCPVCGTRNKFIDFRNITPKQEVNQDPDTEYENGNKYHKGQENTQYQQTGELTQYQQQDRDTGIGDSRNQKNIGLIQIVGSNLTFQLKLGCNVIGRKSANSGANFQINTGEKRSMSREHILIDVKKHPSKGLIHCVSLYKEKVNKTFVGSEQLLFGDCIILKPGDIIKLPDAELKFDIPDEERTII